MYRELAVAPELAGVVEAVWVRDPPPGHPTGHRILRFRRATGLARAGVRFAEVAVTAGYADQAHLAREVRVLSGVPLRALTEITD